MTLPIVLRKEAREEFDQAADWYEEQRDGLGVEFTAEINLTLASIADDPDLHPPVYHDIRRVMAGRFPYAVLYRVEIDQILVVSIFQARRDPAVWQSRV